jgi:hypothetical protein
LNKRTEILTNRIDDIGRLTEEEKRENADDIEGMKSSLNELSKIN